MQSKQKIISRTDTATSYDLLMHRNTGRTLIRSQMQCNYNCRLQLLGEHLTSRVIYSPMTIIITAFILPSIKPSLIFADPQTSNIGLFRLSEA